MGMILDETIEPASFLEAGSKTEYVTNLLRPILSKVVVAVVVLLVGFIVGKLAGKTIHWILRTAEINKRWKEFTGMNWRIETFISAMVSGTIYFIVIIMALTVLGLSEIIAKIISFGLICLIFISLILALKDFIPNYIDGLRLYKRIKQKETIIIENMKGQVEEVTWTDVKILVENGDVLYIPNSLFLKKGFKKVK
ncbi:MAG: mechanosensitive ion channel domain-containing protein [Nanoarchaeota archaeon]